VRAVSVGMVDAVKVLLERGADMNATSEKGMEGSPLEIAADAGFLDVRILVNAGADINARGGWYGSAIAAAPAPAVEEHGDIVAYLVEKGAIVSEIEDRYEGGALDAVIGPLIGIAHVPRSEELVQVLLNAGAKTQAENGWTALHQASTLGRTAVVKTLLESGRFDVNANSTDKPRTALHEACTGDGHPDVVRLLPGYGRKDAINPRIIARSWKHSFHASRGRS
jgi:ankyrin repeat protein